MLLTAITAEGKNQWHRTQYCMLASRNVVALAILTLSLIVPSFGAKILNQSTTGGVIQQLGKNQGSKYKDDDLGKLLKT